MKSKLNMIFVECAGSPRDMGRQYGEQAREAIHANIETFGKSWDREHGETYERITRRLLSASLPDVLEEMDGIAEGSGVPERDILMMNQMNTYGEWCREECTPLALQRSDVGPIVAKNNDGDLQASYRYVMRKCRPERGLPLVQVTYAGWLSGLDSMNAEGLGNTHGSVGSKFDKSGPRVDVRLWLYELMRNCRTTIDLVKGMLAGSLTGKGFSIVVLDAAGHSAVIEAAVPVIAMRDLDRPFIYSTNLYVSEVLKSMDTRDQAGKEIGLRRYGYLNWVEQTRMPATLEDIKRLLSSHEPWAPCRHGGPHLSHTEWSMIGLPAKKTLLISQGPPCVAPYQEVAVD